MVLLKMLYHYGRVSLSCFSSIRRIENSDGTKDTKEKCVELFGAMVASECLPKKSTDYMKFAGVRSLCYPHLAASNRSKL